MPLFRCRFDLAENVSVVFEAIKVFEDGCSVDVEFLSQVQNGGSGFIGEDKLNNLLGSQSILWLVIWTFGHIYNLLQ